MISLGWSIDKPTVVSVDRCTWYKLIDLYKAARPVAAGVRIFFVHLCCFLVPFSSWALRGRGPTVSTPIDGWNWGYFLRAR